MPTGETAPEQVLETGTIDYLATGPYKNLKTASKDTTRSNVVKKPFLSNNPNLTEIEKAFMLTPSKLEDKI